MSNEYAGYIEKQNWPLSFRYQLLDRLRTDCAIYIGYGCRNAHCLWAGNAKDQIGYMKALWDSFSAQEKPDWLSLEQINRLAEKMAR